MAQITLELDLPDGIEVTSYERHEDGHGIEVKWPLPERCRCQRCGREDIARIEYKSTVQVVRDLPLWEQPSFFVYQPPFHRCAYCSHRQDVIPPFKRKDEIKRGQARLLTASLFDLTAVSHSPGKTKQDTEKKGTPTLWAGRRIMLDVSFFWSPPSFTVPDDMTLSAGTTQMLTIQNITAPAGIAGVQWQIDYNDEGFAGDPLLPNTNYSAPYATALGSLSQSYTFAHFGDYDMLVTVIDGVGQSTEYDFDVTVTEDAPALAVSVADPPEGSTVTFTATITNPDPGDTDAIYADFTGDGADEQIDPGQWTSSTTNGNTTIVTFQHYYDESPTSSQDLTGDVYDAEVYVVDDGEVSQDVSVPVTITPAAPTGDLMGITPVTNIAYTSGLVYPAPLDNRGYPAVIISPGGTIQFQNVADPSVEDTADLTYSWRVNGGGWTTSINELELPDADYTIGQVTTVEAQINSPTGGSSATQTIDVYIDPSVSTGSSIISNQIAVNGTFLETGAAAPDNYHFGYPVLNISPAAVGASYSFTFTPTAANLALSPNKAPLEYRYDVQVLDTTPNFWDQLIGLFGWDSINAHVLSSAASPITTDPDFTFNPADYPGASDPNRVIYIVCEPFYAGAGGASAVYTYVLTTPQKPGWVTQIANLWDTITQLGSAFGAAGTTIANAVLSGKDKFFDSLTTGLQDTLQEFTSADNLQMAAENAVKKWLGIGEGFAIPANFSFQAALLSYAGLTVPNIKSMLVQALGANSVAAVEVVAQWFNNVPDTEAGLQQVFNNINNAISTYGAGVSALNLNSLISQLQTAVIGKMEAAAAQAVGTLVAKFVPGFGMVQALLNGFGFLLTNKDSIAQVVTDIVNTVTEVVTNPQAFATDLVQVLDRSLPLLLKFAASQLGLGNLPQQIQNAAQIVPTTVQQTLMTLISAIAKKVPLSGLGNPLFAGQLAPMVQFTYQGVMYDLWAAKQGSSSVIKLSTGGKLVAALSAANFTGGAISLFQILSSDAQALLTVVTRVKPLSTTKNQPLPDAKFLAQEQNLSIKIVADENAMIAPFEAGQCGLLSGCFRANAKLLTSEGWRRVDEICAGALVAARDEFDPEGAVEWKRVEAKFERSGRILELFLNGQEIGTTPEHPFYVKGKGWTEAGALHAGDEVRTEDGWAGRTTSFTGL